jgi:D-alanyl-D-alanine dipeptidase
MSELSGAQWCGCFPTSTSLDDLTDKFEMRVCRFIAALREGGATVTISATYRPPERAYLMHFCCMIADSGQDPAAIPSMTGVDIDWTHDGDIEAARLAARQMKAVYNIRYPAALVSRHTQRRAIDMTITNAPNDVVALGASFGVIKLKTDPPHWSDDGH